MVFIPTDSGEWVSEHFERLARVLKDYDHYLELRWIPPANRTRDDKKPYVVVDVRSGTPVLYASELDTPEEILARVFNADNTKSNVISRLDNMDMARRVLALSAHKDRLEEAEDKAKFLLDSPLNTIQMDGKKFDHQRRVIE